MKKILITGASGFIGTAVVRELAKRGACELTAVTGGRRKIAFPERVNVIEADLNAPDAPRRIITETKPEVVVHLAWKMTGKADRFALTNLDWLGISLRLLRAFAENRDCKRLVFAGSSAEYGSGGSDDLHKRNAEEQAPAPDDLYGNCKAAFGAVAAQACTGIGKEYAHPRLFSVYGAGELSQHGAAAAAKSAAAGLPFVVKAPHNVWDYVYIEDAARRIAELALGNFCGVVNICGTAVTMREFFTRIYLAAGREDLLSFENLDAPGKSLVGSSEKMRDVFGKTVETSIADGTKASVDRRRVYMESGGI
jgi:nucleoside-diphosphate-sugar epimerase